MKRSILESDLFQIFIAVSMLIATTFVIINFVSGYSNVSKGEEWIQFVDQTSTHIYPPKEGYRDLQFEECSGNRFGDKVTRFTTGVKIDNGSSIPKNITIMLNYPWLHGYCFIHNGIKTFYDITGSEETFRSINPTYNFVIPPNTYTEVEIGGFGYGRVHGEVVVLSEEEHTRYEHNRLFWYGILFSVGIFSLIIYALLGIYLKVHHLYWYCAFMVLNIFCNSLWDGTARVLTGYDFHPIFLVVAVSIGPILQIFFTHNFLRPWVNRPVMILNALLIIMILASCYSFIMSGDQFFIYAIFYLKFSICIICILMCAMAYSANKTQAKLMAIMWIHKLAIISLIPAFNFGFIDNVDTVIVALKTSWIGELLIMGKTILSAYSRDFEDLKVKEGRKSDNMSETEYDMYLRLLDWLKVHRSGLNYILSLMSVCESLPPKQHEHLRIIQVSNTTLNNTLGSLKELTTKDIQMSSCSIIKLQEEIRDNCYRIFEHKHLALNFHTDDNVPLHLTLHKSTIFRIVNNLVENGAKYTDEGSVSVSFSWLSSPSELDTLVIVIEDTGPGIAQSVIDQMGKPFEQGDKEGMGTGTGLGLHVTIQLVKLISGTIKCESEEGKGTKFTVSIPACKTDIKNILPTTQPEVSSLFSRFINLELVSTRMLIACDNVFFGQILKQLFAQIGAEVYLINNKTALDAALKKNVRYDYMIVATSNYKTTSSYVGLASDALKYRNQRFMTVVHTGFHPEYRSAISGIEGMIMVDDIINSEKFIAELENRSIFSNAAMAY